MDISPEQKRRLYLIQKTILELQIVEEKLKLYPNNLAIRDKKIELEILLEALAESPF